MGQLDTRILSLYSRDSRQEKFKEPENGQYYSFCFYDAIEAARVDCKGEGACHSLLSAYEKAANDAGRLYASRQFLLAFADIQEEGPASGGAPAIAGRRLRNFGRKTNSQSFS